MKVPRALLLDLAECVLEDRVLMAYGPGLLGNVFMSYNPFSNALIVPNSGGGSGPGGGSTVPGPQFYNLLVGMSANSAGGLGPGSGGTISLFSMNMVPSTMLGTGSSLLSGRAGGGGGGGGSGSVGRSGTANGYGGQFSSGFSFALGSTNNFGMGVNALGSVPVHTYGGGGDPIPQATENGGNANDNTMPDDSTGTMNPQQDSGQDTPGYRGVDVDPRNNLLGRRPRRVPMTPSQ